MSGTRNKGLEDMLGRFKKFARPTYPDGGGPGDVTGEFGVGRLMKDSGPSGEGRPPEPGDFPMTIQESDEFVLFIHKGELEDDGDTYQRTQRVIQNMSLADCLACIASLVGFARKTTREEGGAEAALAMEAALKQIWDTVQGE